MATGKFRALKEHELIGLSDDQLIDYIRGARAADQEDAETLALQMLIYGQLDRLEKRMKLKVPPEDAGEVAREAMASALESAFAGESRGEFGSWLNSIAHNKMVDYWRKRGRTITADPLPTGDDEDEWGQEPFVEFEGVTVDAQRAIQEVYGGLSAQHQAIVDGYVFSDQAAADVAAEVDTSVDNVHQVGSRFRKRLKQVLDESHTED